MTKGKKRGLIVLLIALAAIAGFSTVTTACSRSCRIPFEDPKAYYGCPNSKRVRKLNLRKSKENA